MIKTVLSGSFTFNDACAVIVPLHRSGLDFGWREKRAAAPLFDFKKLAREAGKNETLVHVLALGDGETIGANRNGDYFPKAANVKYHPTFLKAHYFHNHDNKDPQKAFGRVVAAAHNEPMGRVELVIALDDKKASDDLHELEKSGEFPVSMSCRVPYDICSICGNKARTRENYCKHASLMMGQIMENGKLACVINDHPDFFDLSRVWRGADRIAFTLQRLDKAASEGRTLGGAELAELLEIVDHLPGVRSVYAAQKAALLGKMASIQAGPGAAFAAGLQSDDIPAETLAILKSCSDRGAVFSALHRAGVCLPLGSFLDLVGIEKGAVSESDVKRRLHGIFARLEGSEDGNRVCGNGSYDGTTASPTEKVASAVWGLKERYGMQPGQVEARAISQVALRGLGEPLCKSAGAASPQADRLADEYAAYLLSFAQRSNNEFVRNLTALRAFV